SPCAGTGAIDAGGAGGSLERRVPRHRRAGVTRLDSRGSGVEGAPVSTDGSADLAFVNGDVYTVDAARSWAQAVGVRDGRIVAVGTDTTVAGLIGTSTEVIDLGGRMLVPGFQDAHVHPVSSGIEMLQCDLNELASPDAYVGAVAAYAAAEPAESWI